MIPLDDAGELVLDDLDRFGNVKVVASGAVSNSLGTINDTSKLAAWAHSRGAILVCDGAQAAPHLRIDVQTLGADFVAVSGHKMLGPSGIGFLWGRAELLQAMDPFLLGGHMIRHVGDDGDDLGRPAREVRGGDVADGRGGRARRGDRLPRGRRARRDRGARARLAGYALERLGEIPGVTLYGPPADRRAGIVSFNVEGVHPHDVAQFLDLDGVCIRAGHHCCQPLMRKLGVAATNRASFYLYNTPEDVDRLVAERAPRQGDFHE